MAKKMITLTDGDNTLYPMMSQTNLTEADDLDSIRYEAAAWCNNVQNKPEKGGQYGYCLALRGGMLQVNFGYSSSGCTGVYIRYYTNARWYPWTGIAFS